MIEIEDEDQEAVKKPKVDSNKEIIEIEGKKMNNRDASVCEDVP